MLHEIFVAEDHVLVTISGSIYVEEAADLSENLKLTLLGLFVRGVCRLDGSLLMLLVIFLVIKGQ